MDDSHRLIPNSTKNAVYRSLRPVMLIAILEKLAFGISVPILFLLGRTGVEVLAFSLVDWCLGALFLIAFVITPAQSATQYR